MHTRLQRLQRTGERLAGEPCLSELWKLKSQTLRVWLEVVGLPGVEPGTNGLCLPLQLSLPLSGLWSGLSLTFRFARTVSTPSLISQGLARDYHAETEASPNLSDSTKGQSELTPRQPIPSSPCPVGFRL